MAHELRRVKNVFKLWPAYSFSIVMRPSQGFELDMPDIIGYWPGSNDPIRVRVEGLGVNNWEGIEAILGLPIVHLDILGSIVGHSKLYGAPEKKRLWTTRLDFHTTAFVQDIKFVKSQLMCLLFPFNAFRNKIVSIQNILQSRSDFLSTNSLIHKWKRSKWQK